MYEDSQRSRKKPQLPHRKSLAGLRRKSSDDFPRGYVTLSGENISPILSCTALSKLGDRILCSEDAFAVVHKENGPLEIDTSTGCPEVPRKWRKVLLKSTRP